ncbi:hypothetical protein IJ425_04150 [bacterium]|nr:hypothetical protein [bacterium]
MKKVFVVLALCCSCCFAYSDNYSSYYPEPSPPILTGDKALDRFSIDMYHRHIEDRNYYIHRDNERKMRDMQKQIDDLKRQQQNYSYRY